MMKLFLIALVAIAAVSCSTGFEDSDRADLLLYRYQNAYNNAAWGEYSQMFTKDVKMGGANMPLAEGNSNWVDACIALHPTNLKLSFYGEQLNMKENIGTISGYYAYYYPGTEQRIDEVGAFLAFMKKSENGKWKFDRLVWNKLDSEYCITAEWWRKNL